MVPLVVRLTEAGLCSCGQVVAAGERAGTTRQPGHVVCLSCVAAFSTDPDDVASDEVASDEEPLSVPDVEPALEPAPEPELPPAAELVAVVEAAELAEPTEPSATTEPAAVAQPAEPDPGADLPPELPAPVAVVIPADWGPASPTTLPSWQRQAGVKVTLPPAAPVTTRPTAPSPAPAIAVQVALPTARLAPVAEPAPVPEPTSEVTPVAETTARHTPEVVAPAPAPAAPTALEALEALAALEASTSPPAPPVPATPAAPEASDAPADAAADLVAAVAAEAAAMTVPSHRRRTILPVGLLALRPSRGRQPGSTGQSDATTRAVLDGAADIGVLALHDRRMPGKRSRIAHLAFGGGGVYVIDVVRANSARVEVLPGDDLDSHPRDLLVGGRPMAGTVAATQDRVAIVRALLDEVELSTVPVIGVMYFVDASVPSDSELQVAGVQVVGRTGLSALVGSEGALDVEHRETLREYLTERLPA